MATSPELKKVYALLGISDGAARSWNYGRGEPYEVLVVDMDNAHLINSIALCERTQGSAPWPRVLETYPCLGEMIQEAARRGLTKPRCLKTTDWPWSKDIGPLTNAQAKVLLDFRPDVIPEPPTLEDSVSSRSAAISRHRKGSALPKHELTFEFEDTQETLMPAEAESKNIDTESKDERTFKEKAGAKFKEMAKATPELAAQGAAYKLARKGLDAALEKSGVDIFLPDWAQTDLAKASFIWFAGTFLTSAFEHEFFNSDDFPPFGWAQRITEAAALGAATMMGADGFDVVWELSMRGLKLINEFLRADGYELTQEGKFQRIELDAASEAAKDILEELRKERELLKIQRDEFRAEMAALKADPKLSEVAG